MTDVAGEERRLREQAAAKKAKELLRKREEVRFCFFYLRCFCVPFLTL